ncbi:hypothetical protein chiPu_0015806 [Chiloscyllium punctatum]|uniref:Uncharacterized protein n=1 Tax=Chiloscyllium punctatum TaxID=137246 RepID=A0A401T3Q9_CHIPU|nr:hypothetical protein [Chiloscyllium punctatum]
MNFQSQPSLHAGSPGSGSGGSGGSVSVSVLGPPGGALGLGCGSGSGSMPVLSHSGSNSAASATSPAQAQQLVLSNSAAIRAEIQRFESVHPNIYAIYDLIERIEDMGLQNQIREHVISIEGRNAIIANVSSIVHSSLYQHRFQFIDRCIDHWAYQYQL